MLELMDRTSIRAVNALLSMGLPQTTEALLLIGSDGPDPAAELSVLGDLCSAAGATTVVPADTAAESELLLAARRSALVALDAVKGASMIDDVCVPRDRLADLLDGVAAIGERHGLTIGGCAHAGDGNTHPTVCFDPADADEGRRARASFDEIMALGLELGGTITGEHGVSVLKKEWLAREMGPVGVEMQRRLREVFDPAGVLNPGKVL
ncbi:hypothetical protein HCJ92_09995 [Streptomyces sp. ventii]|uniref:FAD-binding oxidoreductase/transferase type 4 C-terminal domain-containing protein n=1 Tax=Streptomyces spiramenti TaxID=2720606 RepID=A0ABX1AHG1_9ACTN|nr:hypothetical protein [Streptomyces spiramenti]